MEPSFISKEAVAYINNKAIYSWLNNPGFVYQFPKEKNGLDIIHISPLKKLIFIDGDEDTGVQHIFQRHRYYTNSFSQSKEGFIKTSRFAKDAGGLNEISAIAEILFDVSNLQAGKNKFPEIVDVYDKKIPSMNNQKFRLIVYKESKIVHTLFPIENNKPIRKYQKLDAVIEYRDFEVVRLVLPYIDILQIVRFGIGGILDIREEKERWHALFYRQESDGTSTKVASALLKEVHVKYNFNIEIRIQQINFYDFTQWEDTIIHRLENDTQLQIILK